jgi:hypothetical protein
MFYGGLNIPNYHWYYAPFFLVGLIFTCSGIEKVATNLFSYSWPSNQSFFGVCIIASLLLFFISITPKGEGGRNNSYADIGSWIKANTPLNSSIATVEIGTIGWYSDRNIIDILGLTNKYNADFISKGDVISWIGKYQPDYILRHSPGWPHEAVTEMLEKNKAYKPVENFDFPGFVLLEKTHYLTDIQISNSVDDIINTRIFHKSMLESSKVGAPMVLIEPGILFAHAPSNLILNLPNNARKLDFEYGIKPGAVGKNDEVCFEISSQKSSRVLYSSCIEQRAKVSSSVGRGSISTTGSNDKELVFKTICKSTCNYAWSYWGVLKVF